MCPSRSPSLGSIFTWGGQSVSHWNVYGFEGLIFIPIRPAIREKIPACYRKRLAGLKFATDEGFLRGEYDLIENRLAGSKRFQPQQRHMSNVARGTRRLKLVLSRRVA